MLLPPPSEDDRYAELLRRVQNLETALRAAFTTISGGAGLRIVDGGTLALVAADGTVIFYIGPVSPDRLDGSPQPGWEVRRADGTLVLQLRDAFPDVDGTLNQALNWFDRTGHIVLADDTDSGQGMARPWVPFVAYPSNSADWPTTTSTTFVTKHTAKGPKQGPKLWVETWANAPTSGAVAEVRVLVNGTPLAPPQQSTPGFVSGLNFGPAVVAGAHMSTLTIEVQARLASGTGTVEVGLGRIEGRQT